MIKPLAAAVLSLSLAHLHAADYEAVPFASKSQPEGETLFSKIAPEASGLQIENNYDDPLMWGERYTEFQTGAVGTGIAAGDVDGDGLVDLYIVSKTAPNKLFRQVAPMSFEDVTDAAKAPGGDTWSTGATFADIDNDGDLDLYVCQFDAPNLLYINDGNGRFTEAAAAAGIDIATGSVVGAFEDYDRDGDLDLFLLTNVRDAIASPSGEPDYLFQNDGTGVFTDVTAAAGIASDKGKGHSATWWDADGDGWPDLYIANDFEAPDFLYKNNGDGTFTDITEISLPHTAWYGMGSDFGDLNNDGRFDFLVADMASTTHFKSKVTMGDMGGWVDYFDTLVTPQYMKNAVFLNTGTHRFMEVAKMTGLASTDWTWSPRFEDFDNDGWIDLHVTNGMARSFTDSDMVNTIKTLKSQRQIAALAKNSPVLREHNLAFRNDGAGHLHFSKVTKEWGLEHEGVSFGSIAADLDNDGDLDLVYSNFEDTVSLYRNDSQSNAIIVELQGVRSNSRGIGAQVTLETPQGAQIRKLTVARGALSSSEPIAHFGLGSKDSVSKLSIHWPSGATQTFSNLESNHRYRITEPDTVAQLPPAKPIRTAVAGLFAESAASLGLDFERAEADFNDMRRQSLLPHRMNQLGGGIAVGDVDGDGDSDIYFSGAKGQVGALYLNNGDGHYAKDTRDQPWNDKAQVEEMAPLFVDVNGDGRLDLYVTSGSVETEPGDPSLKDALYLNLGDGKFQESRPEQFDPPHVSASVAIAADLDRDGDLDLFVGGRVVPGEYPRAPKSALLENRDGALVDVTREVAPELQNSGLVTAALWTDTDGDGWQDLIVLAELDPIRLYQNREGRLTERTEAGGLAPLKGWWNAIASADIDADGDIDYIVSNLGLNTKYKASPAHPFKIYYNDFEGQGKPNIVEAKYEGDTLLPVRGRSCSSRAMPSIADRFPTFHDFGAASLANVYDEEKLETSILKEASELAHGILLNDGAGNFEFIRLPRFAQAAPIYGIGAADFNGDGHIDLALAQNFYGPQVETGRYNGGVGLLLLGDGRGNFTAAEPKQSGILIENEARGLALADLDNDGWPDVLVSRPNDHALAYLNQAENPNGDSVALALRSATPGNAEAVGARATVTFEDGRRQAFELHSGSGYLSQSEPVIFVGYAKANPPQSVSIRWPDGGESEHLMPRQSVPRLEIEQAAAFTHAGATRLGK